MRVVLSADMEAITQMTDMRQLLACCPEYWESGRQSMTDDVVAAVHGLRDAGAQEVILLDNHGSGHPQNVIVEQLPEGSRAESWNVFDLSQGEIDGMLQVGYHPRTELDGFVPHTYVPGLRLWVGDEEISESHGRIWAAQTALLGITGHAAHRRTLGSLGEPPFLTVQEGTDRLSSRPLMGAEEGAQRIREFAATALREAASAPRPTPPRETPFRARLRDPSASQTATMEAAGWRRTGDDEFVVALRAWADAREPLAAAMSAGFEPFADVAQLDLSSRAALETQDQARLERLAARFTSSL